MLLIHPAGFRAAVLFVHVIGWDVVAVFVEGSTQGTILLAHEYFELARGPAPLPAVIGIPHTEVLFGGSVREAALRQKLYVDEAEQ